MCWEIQKWRLGGKHVEEGRAKFSGDDALEEEEEVRVGNRGEVEKSEAELENPEKGEGNKGEKSNLREKAPGKTTCTTPAIPTAIITGCREAV